MKNQYIKKMIIRKLFKFEGAHVVRNCSSDRCKHSIHGHSYKVEVFLESQTLDKGQMVMDFGLLKGPVRDIIDAFDHAYAIWSKEPYEFKHFITENSARYVEMPVSPSAEMFSLMFYAIIKKILAKTEFNNGEKNIHLYSVRVHETETGYAESSHDDYINLWVDGGYKIEDIIFSQTIKDEWKDPEMWDKILNYEFDVFINPIIKPQIQ